MQCASFRRCACIVVALLAAASGPAIAMQAAPAATQPVMTREGLIAAADKIEREVAELRGWPFKHPVKKDVRNEQQLREFILAALDREYGDGKLERKQSMLWLVGLLPHGLDMRQTIIDVLLNQVGGFYDPESKAFYMLIREGVPYVEFVNDILVAHELTHALDDQYLDLAKFTDSEHLTEDTQFAIAAVVEGSATLEMQRFMLKRMEDGASFSGDEMDAYIRAEMRRAESFVTAPPYFSTLLANYLAGMTFLTEGDLTMLQDRDAGRRIQQRLEKLVANPPRSSEQILHPEKYWKASAADEPVMIDDAAVEARLGGAGRHVVHRDTLGELLCGLLTSPADRRLDMMLAAMPDYWTTEASTGWGGDRFYLLSDGPDADQARRTLRNPRGVWVTAWDSPSDCDEFVDDFDTHRPELRPVVQRVGRRAAVFVFGFDESEGRALAEQIAEGVRFRRDGREWSADANE